MAMTPNSRFFRRDCAHQPDLSAWRRHRGACGVVAVTRCNFDDLGENLLGHDDAGAASAAVRCFTRAWKKHDVALHDAGEMILDGCVNVGDIERDSQTS
jgi:hypothetical protein